MALVSLPSPEWESGGQRELAPGVGKSRALRAKRKKFILLTIVSDFHFPQLARDAIFRFA